MSGLLHFFKKDAPLASNRNPHKLVNCKQLSVSNADPRLLTRCSYSDTHQLIGGFTLSTNRLLKYSPTCGLPPLALALFFRQVSVS